MILPPPTLAPLAPNALAFIQAAPEDQPQQICVFACNEAPEVFGTTNANVCIAVLVYLPTPAEAPWAIKAMLPVYGALALPMWALDLIHAQLKAMPELTPDQVPLAPEPPVLVS